MSIDNLLDLFLESENQDIEIFSHDLDEVIFRGSYGDLESNIGCYEILSIDNISNSSTLVLNVE